MTSLRDIQKDSRIIPHPAATAQIRHELGRVYRYADHNVVTRDPEYRISVDQHLGHVLDWAQAIITKAVPDPNLRKILTGIAYNQIIPHDNGEIFLEPTTAVGETDKVLQEKLCASRPTALEAEIASFTFQAAVFLNHQKRGAEFHDYVAETRKTCGAQDNGYGLLDRSAERLIDFCATARSCLDPKIFDKTPDLALWNAPPIVAEVKKMEYFYNDIEGHTDQSFMGRFCKLVEKWEGTHYTLKVHNHKKQFGYTSGTLLHDCPGDEQPRINGRYENGLHALYQQAVGTSDPKLRAAYGAIAAEFTRTAYETSRETYQQGPRIITHNQKTYHATQIVDGYDQILNNPIIIPRPGLVLNYL